MTIPRIIEPIQGELKELLRPLWYKWIGHISSEYSQEEIDDLEKEDIIKMFTTNIEYVLSEVIDDEKEEKE